MRFIKVYFRESMGSSIDTNKTNTGIETKKNKEFIENAKKVEKLLKNYNSLQELLNSDKPKDIRVKMELMNNPLIVQSSCNVENNFKDNSQKADFLNKIKKNNIDPKLHSDWKKDYYQIAHGILNSFKKQLIGVLGKEEVENLLDYKKNNCNPVDLIKKLKSKNLSDEQINQLLFATASLKQNQTLKELFKYNITVDDLKKGRLTKKLNSLSKEDKAIATELVKQYLKQKNVKEFEDYFFGIYVDDMPNYFFMFNEEFIGKIENEDKLFSVLKDLKKEKNKSLIDIQAEFRKYLAPKFYSSFEYIKKVYNIFAKKGEKISYLPMVQNIDFDKLSDKQKEEFLSMMNDKLIYVYSYKLDDISFIQNKELKKKILNNQNNLLNGNNITEKEKNEYDFWNVFEDIGEITVNDDIEKLNTFDKVLLKELDKLKDSSYLSKVKDKLPNFVNYLVSLVQYLPRSFDFIKKTPDLLREFTQANYKFYHILPDNLQKEYSMAYLNAVFIAYNSGKGKLANDPYATALEISGQIRFDTFNDALTILSALYSPGKEKPDLKNDNGQVEFKKEPDALFKYALKRPLFKRQLANIFKKPENQIRVFAILDSNPVAELDKQEKAIIKYVKNEVFKKDYDLIKKYEEKLKDNVKNIKSRKEVKKLKKTGKIDEIIEKEQQEKIDSGKGIFNRILKYSGLEGLENEKKEALKAILFDILNNIKLGKSPLKAMESLFPKISDILEKSPKKFEKFIKGLEKELVKLGKQLKDEVEKTELKEKEAEVLKKYTFKEGKKHIDLSKLSKDYQDFVKKYREKIKNQDISKEDLIELFLQSEGITDKSIRKDLYKGIKSYLSEIDAIKILKSTIRQGETNGWKKVMEDIQKGDFSAIEEDYYNSYFSLDEEYKSIKKQEQIEKEKQAKQNQKKIESLPQDDPINILYGENNEENNELKIISKVGDRYTVKNPFARNTDPTIEEEIIGTKENINKQLIQDGLKSLGFYFVDELELPEDEKDIENLLGVSLKDNILDLNSIKKAIDNIVFSIIYKLENKKIKNRSLKDWLNEDIKKIKMGDKTAIKDLFKVLNDNMYVLKQIQFVDATETKFLATNLESFDNLDFVKYKEKYS